MKHAILTAALIWSMSVFCLGLRAQTLEIDTGVVVKFAADSGIAVHTSFKTQGTVVFTSIDDDGIGGQTNPTPGLPVPGDWFGIRVDSSIPGTVVMDGAEIRYAGQGGQAGLELLSNQHLNAVTITDSTVGLRIIRESSPVLTGFQLRNNHIGVRSDSAYPNISESEIYSNLNFGAQNLTPPRALTATGNWWGDATGPFDPLDNPGGQGDSVTAGVLYGQFLTSLPLIDCVITPSDGYYTVNSVEVTLDTRCRNATQLRLSESQLFGGATYSALTPNRSFTLSPIVGAKRVYAQFRGPQGQTKLAVVDLTLQGDGPQVQITTPIDGTVITNPNAIIEIAALATDTIAIESVQFYINGVRIATDAKAPYSTQLDTTGRPDGLLGVLAVATNINQAASTARVSVELRRPQGPGDTSPPIVSNLRFDGEPLVDGATFTTPGILTATIVDDGTITVTQLRVNGIVVSSGTQQQSVYAFPVTFDGVPNGPIALELTVRDIAGNQTVVSRSGSLMLSPPAVPEILYPAADAVVRNNRISVLGTGNIGNRIQLYLDDQPIAQPVPVGINGSFSTSITLATDGPHTLSADATNSLATSQRSELVPFSYVIPPPSIIVTSPPVGAIVSANMNLSASVIDQRAGTNVEFFLDDVSVGIDNLAPFTVSVDTAGLIEGVKTVRALLRNTGPETSEATSQFIFRRDPAPPQPFVPPYVGSGLSVSPLISSGNSPITVNGRLREAGSPASMPNAALTLVSRTNGFDRRINLVSDQNGDFSYTFTPNLNDEGDYSVTAMHPNATPFVDTTATGVAEYNISRLSVTRARIGVAAAQGFPQLVQVSVRNSVGSLAQGVRLIARPEDQPSGSLPAGMSFDGGASSGIASGGLHTFDAMLDSELTSAPSGSLIVAVLEDSSGNLVRAKTRLDYELFPAIPALLGTPVSVYTGVRRGEVASESFELENKGLVPADDVQAELVPGPSGTVPSWISLVSSANLGSLGVGEERLLELRFAPTDGVVDGVYDVKLRVTSSNAQGGEFFVTVAVSEAGESQARFHAVDNFTSTLDANGDPILGLTGARISLQNEANANIRTTAMTGTDGMVVLGPLPPGRYSYQATASGHSPASGRVILRPGITVDERVFLDIAALSFTWSVTPTTIPDNYNVVLSAVYSTIVPAPVVILEPTSVNLPLMNVGEFTTGEFTITNRGLIRADDVSMTLPQSNAYYDIEVLGTVPNELAAGQTVTLPYRVTAIQELPGSNAAPAKQSLSDWLQDKPVEPPKGDVALEKMSSCGLFSASLQLRFEFVCPAGDVRNGTAFAQFARALGNNCSSANPPTPIGQGAGWGGIYGIGGSGGPLFVGTCGPDCAEGCACSSGCGAPSGPPLGSDSSGVGVGTGNGDNPPKPPCAPCSCCNQ